MTASPTSTHLTLTKLLPVSELYGPVTQGEGAVLGLRTMMLRLGGCDGPAGNKGVLPACLWCDSLYSVDPEHKATWRRLPVWDIVRELRTLASHCWQVTITGGNPALHDLSSLIDILRVEGYGIAVETQGTLFREWLRWCDLVTVSPKPPSAGVCTPPTMVKRFIARVLSSQEGQAPARVALKIVVDPDSQEDYAYAKDLALWYAHAPFPTYLTCCTHADDTRDTLIARYQRLEARVLTDLDLPDVHVGVQWHVVVHGAGRRGI